MRLNRRSSVRSLSLSAFFLLTATAIRAPGKLAGSPFAWRTEESELTVLKGNTHPLARPEFDRGIAPSFLPMERMLLVLKRSAEREAALQEFLAGQFVKSSPNYHRWLTPEQFGQQFGPSERDIHAVRSWLESHGFQLARVSKGGMVVEFSGTAELVRQAFHTEIHRFVVDGEEHWANTSDPSIPTVLTSVITGLDTLHNFPKQPISRVVGIFSRSRGTGEVTQVAPQFTFASSICGRQGNTCYGVGPYDFGAIYKVRPLWDAGIDGSGQAIAITADSNINIQDARNFRSLFGLPAKDPVVIINGADPGPLRNAHETEAAADVQWTGAVAKGATIELVVSASTNSTSGFDLSAEFIVDNSLAPILSGSYSACELVLGTAGNQFHNQLWQQAAAQGITVLIGAADTGSAACDNSTATPAPATMGLAVNGIASTPNNTAVGGTDFNDAGNQSTYWNPVNDPVTHASANGYIPEMTWNDSCTNTLFGSSAENNCNAPQLVGLVRARGTGGGKSNCTTSDGSNPLSCSSGYSKPAWQAGPGVPNDGVRDIPDVSLFAAGGLASGSFYIICQADADPDQSAAPCDLNSPFMHFLGVAGNSISVQAFAGMMALVDQKAASRQGNANPVLYPLAAQQSPSSCNASSSASTCIFHDVTIGTNAAPCAKGSRDCDITNQADSYGVLAGYDATSGYDLATGLGSPDAFNLINASGWGQVTSAPDFTVSSANPVVTVHPGSSGALTLTIASTNGFSGTFNLTSGSCSAMPVGSNCSFSPTTVTISQGNPTAMVTLTVMTAATSMGVPAAQRHNRDNRRIREPLLLAWILCIGFLLLGVYRSQLRWPAAFALLVLGFIAAAGGCGSGGNGGGGGNPGIPPGTTNAVFTIASGGTTHSLVFTINVQ